MDGDNLTYRYMNFWRRLILLAAIIIGSMLIFYKVPALLTVSWVDFTVLQQQESKPAFGFVSEERKRLQALPLEQYIKEKTQGKVFSLDAVAWQHFFKDIYLAETGQREAKYAERISSRDVDRLKWQTGKEVYAAPVFFAVDEFPLGEWTLLPKEREFVYLATVYDGSTKYLRLEYHDYLTASNPMASVYPEPPKQLYYPYRIFGLGVLAIGLLLAVFLPKPRKQENIIEYPNSRLIAGDIVAVILLLLFWGLPFLINGGTVQAVSGWWGLSLVFWLLAVGPVFILYASALYASFQVRLGEQSFNIARAGGEREYPYDTVEKVEQVELRSPAWFRKLFWWVLVFSFLSGRGVSASTAGTHLLNTAAAYTGLALYFKDGQIKYIWITDALGNVILPGYERIIQALEAKGVPYRNSGRVIEKLLPLP